MTERQITTQPSLGVKDINISDRANEPEGGHSSSGMLSWYFAQPLVPGLRYLMTVNGYVVLP
jgi:hypothetical protein